MASKRKNTHDVEETGCHGKAHRHEEKQALDTPSLPAPAARDVDALLTDPEVGHPANAPLRARALTELQHQGGNEAAQRLLLAKLTVSQPGDAYEREADRVANQMMAMPEPQAQRRPSEEEEEELQAKPLADPITPLAQRQEDLEEEELFAKPRAQRQADPEDEELEEELMRPKQRRDQSYQVESDLEARVDAVRAAGRPLSSSEQEFFEPRFGQDFGEVRIHTDGQAAEVASDLEARAFTVGRDVVFGAGEHAPETTEGKRLLAHELTHVVQQAGPALQRAPAPKTGTVTVGKPTYTSFNVTGDTLADVYKVLSRRTEWGSCKSNFSYTYGANGKITKANVTVKTTIELPKWTGLEKASKAAKKEWKRMMAALKKHELGHYTRAKRWAPKLKARLVGQPAAEEATIFDKFKSDAKAVQEAYDDATKHGQTQGVSLDLSIK